MREQIYDILESYPETILDSRSIDWSKFEYNREYILHNITEDEIMRPYLISTRYYGSIKYEDILLLLNNIEDVFEIVPGSELIIPDEQDIRDFIVKNRK